MSCQCHSEGFILQKVLQVTPSAAEARGAEAATAVQVAERHDGAVDDAEAEPQTLYVKNLAWKTGRKSQNTCMRRVILMGTALNASGRCYICQGAALCMLQMTPRSDAISTKQLQQLVAPVAQQRRADVNCGRRCVIVLQPILDACVHWHDPPAASAAFTLPPSAV